MESLPITGLESCIPKMQRKLVWDYLWGEVSLLCSQAHNRRKSHWGPKTAFINCDVLFCVGFFSLNILCFLTINHILWQKAFKETGHGVCFRSLAGEAGHQLTAVINPQLSDQSIFLRHCGDGAGGPWLCQPTVPCHPRQPWQHPGGSPVLDPFSLAAHSVRAMSHYPRHHPLKLPSMFYSQLSQVTLKVSSRDLSESGHSTSCPSTKPTTLKKAIASFPSRGYTKSLLGDKPSQEVSYIPSHLLFFAISGDFHLLLFTAGFWICFLIFVLPRLSSLWWHLHVLFTLLILFPKDVLLKPS